MNLHDLSFDKSWTLFLDRDGVINRRIPGGYVTRWEEFDFLEGVLNAIDALSGIFGRIIIVSNQQGVGKGLMGMSDVEAIHHKMVKTISGAGGRIDRVYFSPHLDREGHPDRKPGTGMARKALKDFPEIRLERSVMVGDSQGDMQFGRNIGSVNIWISHKDADPIPEDLFDLNFTSLLQFADNFKM